MSCVRCACGVERVACIRCCWMNARTGLASTGSRRGRKEAEVARGGETRGGGAGSRRMCWTTFPTGEGWWARARELSVQRERERF